MSCFDLAGANSTNDGAVLASGWADVPLVILWLATIIRGLDTNAAKPDIRHSASKTENANANI